MPSPRFDEPLMPHASLDIKQSKSQHKVSSQARASISIAKITQEASGDVSKAKRGQNEGISHRDSQDVFSTKEQTIIIFDWDDTLFPTTWVRHEKGLHWRYPLEEQTKSFSDQEIATFKKQLSTLQKNVDRILTQAMTLGHVVIVTLARPPWVELSCDNFFQHIGRFVKKHSIKIVYAQDLAGGVVTNYDKQKFQCDADAEKFWIQKKQTAIMGEISDFYSKSESSWKNIISLGDSDFERYATQASLLDYATHDEETTATEPVVGSAGAKLAVLQPSKSKSKAPDNHAVSGWVGRHYRRLRCKTVKMFDSPGIEDLITEMSMLFKWMPYLVERDAGFDVDLEDETMLYDAHRELTGENLTGK
eukprot:GEMP01063706.1.p1 GENE.GEMP01063706.1~~GEMP01063706.1.p1  ORF type:complete len:362 (+),score=95.80 GEMP01063706.1:94-1179(+)